MKNTEQIATAIRTAAGVLGGNTELANRVGLHKSTIGNYINGIVDDIRDEHWERLWPYVRQYLPDTPAYMSRRALAGVGAVAESETAAYSSAPELLLNAARAWPLLTTDTRNTILGVLRFAAPEITAKLAGGRDGDGK